MGIRQGAFLDLSKQKGSNSLNKAILRRILEMSNTSVDIDNNLISELYSIDSLQEGTVEEGGLTVKIEKVDSEKWEITLSGASESVIIREGYFSPNIFVKSMGMPTSANRAVINGKIPASSLSIDDNNSDLGHPRIDTLGISRDEVDRIKKYLDNQGIKYIDRSNLGIGQHIELTKIPINADLDVLRNISGRITYPTDQENSEHRLQLFDPRTLTLSNDSIKSIAEDTKEKLSNSKAASIMSDTPLRVSEEYAKSLPKIVGGDSDLIYNRLKHTRSDDYHRLKLAAEKIEPYLQDKDFLNAAYKEDLYTLKDKLGVSASELIPLLRHDYGIDTGDLKSIATFEKNRIELEDGRKLNMLVDTENQHEANILANAARRKQDKNIMKFNIHTINGERMYVYGGDSYIDNTELRENLSFLPNKKVAKKIKSSNKELEQYKRNVKEALGGALIEDKIVDGGKHKYSSKELQIIADDFLKSGEKITDDNTSARVRTLIKAKNKADKGQIDTSAGVTLDATFSGLVVTSGILGRKDGLDKVNVVPKGEKLEEMHDLYTEVGHDLIQDLKQYGMDGHAARKLVKPGVMPAMYNSSQRARSTKLTDEVKSYLREKTDMSEQDISKAITHLKPNINKTTKDATDILMGKVNPESIIDLTNKGILTLYKPDEGVKVKKINKPTTEDLDKVSAYKIKHPDGKVSYSAKVENEVKRSTDGKIVVDNGAKSVPYAEVKGLDKQGNIKDKINLGYLMNSLAPGIARHMDSYVASYMVEQMHKENIPVVTVHDSFTFPVYALDRVKEIYNDAVNSLYKHTGSKIRVDATNNLSVE